jgi:hypothetical protein
LSSDNVIAYVERECGVGLSKTLEEFLNLFQFEENGEHRSVVAIFTARVVAEFAESGEEPRECTARATTQGVIGGSVEDVRKREAVHERVTPGR